MIRQFATIAVLGLMLSACGMGVEEELGSQSRAMVQQQAAVDQQADSPAFSFALGIDINGVPVLVASPAVGLTNPGDAVASTPDPIPPKILHTIRAAAAQ